MIFRSLLVPLAALALALPLAVTGGCASSANAKGEKASESIQSVASELKTTSDRIGATLSSLGTLTSSNDADLRSSFKKYAEDLDRLISSAKSVESHANKMASQGDAYFADWDKKIAEIQNEDIKARSQARREEVRARLARIKTLYQDAKAQFKPFLSDLKDIKAALNTDLTAAGIAAIQPAAQRATAQGAAVRGTIESLTTEFRALGVEMSAQAPAAK